MLSRIFNRKWVAVLAVLLLALFLTGCAPASTNVTHTTEDLRDGGFWQSKIVYPLAITLDTFADWFNGEYGFAILLLTIIIRTAILPLTLKQYRSSKAMQALQPQIAKLKEKYKDDVKKQQEETMKLFQENQVNPMAGCLPMFIQMPVFIALYNSIYWNPAIRDHSFLGIKMGLAVNDDAQAWFAYSLSVLAAITTFVQSKMMQKQQANPMPMMQGMLFIFPILIFVMSLSLPAALPLYWVFSNIYTIVQNYFLYGRTSSSEQGSAAKK